MQRDDFRGVDSSGFMLFNEKKNGGERGNSCLNQDLVEIIKDWKMMVLSASEIARMNRGYNPLPQMCLHLSISESRGLWVQVR